MTKIQSSHPQGNVLLGEVHSSLGQEGPLIGRRYIAGRILLYRRPSVVHVPKSPLFRWNVSWLPRILPETSRLFICRVAFYISNFAFRAKQQKSGYDREGRRCAIASRCRRARSCSWVEAG